MIAEEVAGSLADWLGHPVHRVGGVSSPALHSFGRSAL